MKKLFLASEIDVCAKHLAKQIKKPVNKLKTVFIPTAAEPETGDKKWVKDNKKGLVEAGFNVFDYTITGRTPKEIEKDLNDVDVIHVNGGNTFYLLLQARISGFDKFVRKQIKKGVIYTGSSAGSIITSPNIEITRKLDTKIYAKALKTFEGFNLVDFNIFPHWGSDYFKEFYLNRRLEGAYKTENKIILLNDYQYVQVTNDEYKIVDIRTD